MSANLESFEKFNYGLRPSKQVERKLLIEALHKLVKAGYPIQDYTYLGFGSVYYIDFILFHKYLYIDDMICVEGSDVPKRMKFNKPFKFIKVKMNRVSEIITNFSERKKHLVWLDYDYILNADVLQDVSGFLRRLAPGSVFLVTVDAEPKLVDRALNRRLSEGDRLNRLLVYLRDQCAPFFSGKIEMGDLSPVDLPKLFIRILQSHCASVISRRSGLTFHQLFNCVYADGARMLTFGGLIDEPKALDRLTAVKIYGDFVTKANEPVEVSVPPLTVREKLWLDQHLNISPTSRRFAFEMDETMVKNYAKFYKQYPLYHESLT